MPVKVNRESSTLQNISTKYSSYSARAIEIGLIVLTVFYPLGEENYYILKKAEQIRCGNQEKGSILRCYPIWNVTHSRVPPIVPMSGRKLPLLLKEVVVVRCLLQRSITTT